jgi:6-phosphogluconate dehydrogenase
MCKSLSRNLASNGFRMAMYNREVHGKEENVVIDLKNEFEELSNALPFNE